MPVHQIGKVLRRTACNNRRVRLVYRGAGVSARQFSTEGASLRKVFQRSAKETVAKAPRAAAAPGARPNAAGAKDEAGRAAARVPLPHASGAAPSRPLAAPKPAVMRDVVAGSAGNVASGVTGGGGGNYGGSGGGGEEHANEDRDIEARSPQQRHAPKAEPAPSPVLPFHQGNYMEFAPRITVVGCGGAGGNAVNNMIARNLKGVEFLVCNTDAQHLSTTLTDNRLQLGRNVTEGLGCGANPDAGRQAATESKDEIMEAIEGSHMVFITAGMGGGTGTGAAPVIAETCMEAGILTVAVVTKPFGFEGSHRMRLAEEGLRFLSSTVDTLIVIPNQNLFQLVDKQTSLLDSFRLADDVLLAGVRSVTDLMVNPGLINLDFADVQAVMAGMGNAMMGTGEAEGEGRATRAAEDALCNPLLGELSVRSAKGVLVNITGGADMTLFEVDEAATRVTNEVDDSTANIIFGSTYDSGLNGAMRVSVVATGIDD